MRLRKIATVFPLVVLVFFGWGCKKSPTTSSIPTPTGLTASFNPTSAGPNSIVSLVISISANGKEIRAFGGAVAFDAGMFSFQDAAKGNLTGSWELVDANESDPGTVRLGGSMGGGTSVAANSNGTLIEVRFKVTGGSYANGQQNRVCLAQFTDDLAQFTSGEACAVFTLKK